MIKSLYYWEAGLQSLVAMLQPHHVWMLSCECLPSAAYLESNQMHYQVEDTMISRFLHNLHNRNSNRAGRWDIDVGDDCNDPCSHQAPTKFVSSETLCQSSRTVYWSSVLVWQVTTWHQNVRDPFANHCQTQERLSSVGVDVWTHNCGSSQSVTY